MIYLFLINFSMSKKFLGLLFFHIIAFLTKKIILNVSYTGLNADFILIKLFYLVEYLKKRLRYLILY
jgi:hypothetical protein